MKGGLPWCYLSAASIPTGYEEPLAPQKTVVEHVFCSLSTSSGIHAACVLQFPDPHFKMKHKKRRVIQPELVHALAHLMPPGGDFPAL